MDDPAPSGSPAAGADDPAGVLAEEDRRYRLALDRAVRLLAQREHSMRELIAKLAAKGVDAATAGLVVDDLRGRGLQSDLRFAEAFVHSRIGRGHGPVRIRQELAQRGIARELADEALDGCAERWLELAEAARRKKFGDAPPADRGDWARQARFLTGRGFPAELIRRVLGDDVAG